MKNNGFTLIELMIVVFIVGIFVAIISEGISGNPGNVSIGINGITETRCIGGYTFLVSPDGTTRQIYNNIGHGVQCGSLTSKGVN